jgi:structural maintenance of chromosome 2
VKADFETAKAAVAAKNAELNKCSKEIKELEKEKDRHLREGQAKGLEARKIAHRLKEWEKDAKESAKLVGALLKAHPWIEKEKQFFGQEGSDFDFRSKDINQCAKRHKELKAEQVAYICEYRVRPSRWLLTDDTVLRRDCRRGSRRRSTRR